MNNIKCNNDWEASIDTQPPNRGEFRVAGSCSLPDNGYKVSLRKTVPQEFSPEELSLTIHVEAHGELSHIVTNYPLKYSENNAKYQTVRVLPCDIVIKVKTVS